MNAILHASALKQPATSKKSLGITTDDNLRHLAFDNCVQANIISTAGMGRMIMANNAACKLLGYSKKELLTKSRAAIFDITESSFQKMIKQRTSEGHSIALATAIKKNGKPFPCIVTSAVFLDEHGIKLAITTISDMSQSILNQKKIDTKNKKIVANNIVLAKSAQKLIDVRNEKIVSDNIVQAKSDQKEIDTKNKKIVSDNIDLAKSVQKKIDVENKKIVADNIILAQAKSDARQAENNRKNKELEDKLKYEFAAKGKQFTEYTESFKLIFNSASDVFFDIDLVTNVVIVSEGFEKEFGFKVTDKIRPFEDWFSHIHPGDKEKVKEDYEKMLASDKTESKSSFRYLRADATVANVISNRIILRTPDGKAYRIIGSIQDLGKQKALEERKEVEIKLNKKQIEDAMEEAKETERSDIGKELHDNVNQLLSASRMYLEMAKRGGENSGMCLNRSSEYTLEAIEEIRKLTKVLTTNIIKDLGLCDAVDNLTRDTMETGSVIISCTLESFEEGSVNDKFKLNIYRIVQEHLNNILKHAHATEVTISLLQNKRSIMLTISDNGIGFDTDKKQKGIGVVNIKSRAVSYNGMAEFVSQPGHGCVLTVRFPLTDGQYKY